MKPSKRRWSRSEKLLFLAPALLLAFAAFVYQWRGAQPVEILTTAAPLEWKFSPDGRFIAVRHQLKYVNYLDVYDAQTGALKVNLRVAKTGLPKGVADLVNFSWASDSKSLAAGYFDLQTGTRSYLENGKTRKNFIPKLAVWDFPSGVMRGYWPAAKPSEFADTPAPQFTANDNKIWSEGMPPSLFDANSGNRLRSFGTVDSNRNWSIDPAAKQALDKVRTEVAKASKFPLNADVRIEAKHNGGVAVGQLDERKIALRNLQSGQFWTMPPQKYVSEQSLAHSRRAIALIDRDRRLLSKHGSGAVESSRLIVWDFANEKELWKKQAKYIYSASWSPNDRVVAFLQSDDSTKWRLTLADAQNGQVLWESSVTEGTTQIVWSPLGDRIALRVKDKLKILNLPASLI